ncbi:MFS transporter [Meridianimarinicoccus sp. MJW13]|uniref:MFS transporter n=1 Tax=Meridianimarinicoccus sp. MJW13 TaxID=2720031 RepID=UPI001D00DA9F|nr:MFS transporter [Fluviibacterium sp. MJW13]
MQMPDPRFLRSNAPWLSAGFLIAFGSGYGQTFFISVFAAELQAEFGLSHAGWGALYSAGTLLSALAMIWAGGWADRMRVRCLGALIMLGMAAACLGMATVASPAMLVIVILGLRFFGQGMSTNLASIAMARWFASNRGKALAFATLGFAAAEALLPVGFVALKPLMSWRMLWVLAAFLAVLAIPVLFVLLRRERTPQSLSEATHAPGMAGRHWTRAQALRHPLFWCALPSIMSPAIFMTAFYFHQVHVAQAKGLAHAQLVTLFPLATLVSVSAVIGSGILIDRLGARRLMTLFQLPMAAGFAVLGVSSGLGMTAVGLMLLSATIGGFMTVSSAFWAEFYGTRHMGSIRAGAASALVLGTAIGPVVTGALIDAGVPMVRQMPLYSLIFLANTALLAMGFAASARRGETPVRV